MKTPAEKKKELDDWCQAFADALLKDLNKHVKTFESISVQINDETNRIEVNCVPAYDLLYSYNPGPLLGRMV